MKRIVLVGASGHGKVSAEIAKLNGYGDIIFLDDNLDVKRCSNYNVVGSTSDFYQFINDDTEFFVSIGNHEIRKQIQEKIENAGGTIKTLIHPQATISEDVSFGAGTVVMAGAVINPGTKIGKGTIINTSSSVDHDCTIGDWCHVAVGSHICGTVSVGVGCWIGAGSIVSNNISVCDEVFTGAGAIVVHDIQEPGTYVGVPAKRIKGEVLNK